MLTAILIQIHVRETRVMVHFQIEVKVVKFTSTHGEDVCRTVVPGMKIALNYFKQVDITSNYPQIWCPDEPVTQIVVSIV